MAFADRRPHPRGGRASDPPPDARETSVSLRGGTGFHLIGLEATSSQG